MSADHGQFAFRYFGDFVLLGEISRGGMGVVHSARQLGLNRRVALKLIRPEGLPTDTARQRFQLEAEAMARLDHPNIASVYEVGEEGGQPYIAMKLVEGGDLERRLRSAAARGNGAWAPAEAARLMLAIAQAVHHAHRQGVLHCDLKPANILLTEEGVPLVADFGIARLVEPSADVPEALPFLGTAGYVAPELAAAGAAGPPTPPTTASDVYSLGVILYRLLTGRLPFEGAKPEEILAKARSEAPPRPSTLRREIDRDLEAICLRCLEKTPEQRYASTAGLAQDLEHWLHQKPVQARPVGPVGRLRKWIRRNPVVAGLVVVALGLALLGLSSTLWQFEQARRHMQASSAANARLAESLIRLGVRDAEPLLMGGRYADGVQKLVELLQGQPANDALRARLFAALTERRVAWPELPALVHGAPVGDAAFSPGGHYLVTSSEDNRLYVWDRASGVRRLVLPHALDNGRFALGPKDGLVATLSPNRSVQVWRLPEGELAFELDRPLAQRPAGTDVSPAFSVVEFDVSGQWLAVAETNGWAAILPANGGAPVALIDHGEPLRVARLNPAADELLTVGASRCGLWSFGPPHDATQAGPRVETPRLTVRPSGPVSGAGFNTRGGRFYTLSGTVAEIWDAASGDRLQQFRFSANLHCGLLSANGRLFACGTAGNRAHLYDVETGTRVGSMLRHDAEVVAVDLDRRPSRFVTGTDDGRAFVWTTDTTALWCTPASHARHLHRCVLNATGDRLLTASDDHTARLWALDHGAERDVGLISGLRTDRLVVSPDGQHVADVSVRGRIFVFDAQGRAARDAVVHDVRVQAVEFSPDGSRLASVDTNGVLLVSATTTNRYDAQVTVTNSAASLTWDPDGVAVAAVGTDSIEIVWAGTDAARSPMHLATASPRLVRLSPRAERALWISGESVLQVAELAGASATPRRLPTRGIVRSLALSPDGRRAAIASDGDGIVLWWLTGGRAGRTRLEVPSAVTSVVFGTNSTQLVTGDREGALQAWDLGRLPSRREVAQYSGTVIGLAVSPDGQWALSHGANGGLQLTHLASGLPGWSPLMLPGFRNARFSADGRYVLLQTQPPAGASARRIELPGPSAPPTEVLLALAELIVGQHLNGEGKWTELTAEMFQVRRALVVGTWGLAGPPPRNVNFR